MPLSGYALSSSVMITYLNFQVGLLKVKLNIILGAYFTLFGTVVLEAPSTLVETTISLVPYDLVRSWLPTWTHPSNGRNLFDDCLRLQICLVAPRSKIHLSFPMPALKHLSTWLTEVVARFKRGRSFSFLLQFSKFVCFWATILLSWLSQ